MVYVPEVKVSILILQLVYTNIVLARLILIMIFWIRIDKSGEYYEYIFTHINNNCYNKT